MVDQKLERKIQEKRQEIEELRAKIRDAETYISAMEEARRLLMRSVAGANQQRPLRPGTMIAAVVDFLSKRGGPAHISDLVVATGKENTAENRISLGGTLSTYVNKGVLTKVSPNTFALPGQADAKPGNEKVEPSVECDLRDPMDIPLAQPVSLDDDDIPF